MTGLSPAQIADIQRWREQRVAGVEPPPTDRTEFERDADRLWYASSFSRLQGVVQVASAPRRIVFHNRYTHSVKVARLGLRVAQRLLKRTHTAYGDRADSFLAQLGGLDPSVVEAAGLAHDLGHPPFGHHGESVLDTLVGPSGFNGNAQTLRVLAHLAVREVGPPGLNLTRATLFAVLKYPWPKAQVPGRDRSWGYYGSERPLIEALRANRPHGLNPFVMVGDAPSVEASIMDWADDITYAVHDVEDFFRAGLIPLSSLRSPEAWAAVIEQGAARSGSALSAVPKLDLDAAAHDVTGRMNALLVGLGHNRPYDGSRAHEAHLTMLGSQLIGTYVNAASLRLPDETDRRTLAIDDGLRCEVLLLKELAWHYVINRPGLAGIQFGQARALRDLYSFVLESLRLRQNQRPHGLPFDADVRLIPKWAYAWLDGGSSLEEVARDIVASLDEDKVRDLTLRFSALDPGSVLDEIL